MLVKLVSGSDPADFQIFDDVLSVAVLRSAIPPTVQMLRRDLTTDEREIGGSVYVMNDAGTTVDRFTVPRG